MRRTEYNRKTVRHTVRGGEPEIFRPRTNSLEAYLHRLDAAWSGGCHNGAELWRRLHQLGFRGSHHVVSEWDHPSPAKRMGADADARPIASGAGDRAADDD